MKRNPFLMIAAMFLIQAAFSQKANPLAGRWGFNLTSATGNRALWLGITEKGGGLEIWYQPAGGHVYQVNDFKVEGAHLTVTVSPATADRPAEIWELDAAGGRITGVQKRGSTTLALTGSREPPLARSAPAAWTAPERLFNGNNLDGWEAIGNAAASRWIVRDGLLINEDKGANLKSTRRFDDFKVHFEVICPDKGNSGFYLRGRYEVQIAYESPDEIPPNRSMGAIYGRLAPKDLPRNPGQWDIFDVTLVGRTVTVVRNGVVTIDQKEIEGITGGALDASEGEPGPFYIQGDHTGGLKFRHISVSVPKRQTE
jgi:hypothetical protein